MQVTKDVEEKYPLCARYVRNFLKDPDDFKKRYSKVWNAFIRACTVDLPESKRLPEAQRWAREGFTLGNEPWIAISLSYMRKAGDCGDFNGSISPKFLWIAPETFEAYENGTGWIVLEGTILHELVHWVRAKAADGGPDPEMVDAGNDEIGEVGNLFTKWAYGGLICVAGANKKVIQYGPPDLRATVQ